MRFAKTAAALAALMLVPLAVRAAVPAPKADIASFAELQTPLPYPYDETGDADAKTLDAKLAAAHAKAKREHKLLLIDYGGNWCPDCRILAGTMKLPAIGKFADAHYVEVTVDSGRHMDQNLQVASRYGVTKLAGVPNVLVVDPRTDKLVDDGHTSALSDARHMTPQALADWLAEWPAK